MDRLDKFEEIAKQDPHVAKYMTVCLKHHLPLSSRMLSMLPEERATTRTNYCDPNPSSNSDPGAKDREDGKTPQHTHEQWNEYLAQTTNQKWTEEKKMVKM